MWVSCEKLRTYRCVKAERGPPVYWLGSLVCHVLNISPLRDKCDTMVETSDPRACMWKVKVCGVRLTCSKYDVLTL